MIKKTLKRGAALFLAGAIDGSLGVLLVFAFSKIFHHPVSFWIYLAGIILALIPDIDLFIQKIFEKRCDGNHRKYLHYPLFIFPLFFFLSFFSLFWAYLVCLCLITHFIHDSGGNEENRWGIKWLWPFSDNYYQFFGKKRRKFSVILEWTPREIEKRVSENWDSWLSKNYLKFPAESFVGILLGIFALIIVFWRGG
ncbi:metal-dependent hydrolase [Patescibacteria group bacterium]|nr:metal-dependent hydrolase [Patescibacteria group bacterium]MBU2633210.1 metal-dependent hydrolase [Patescibacteria group bacterium]